MTHEYNLHNERAILTLNSAAHEYTMRTSISPQDGLDQIAEWHRVFPFAALTVHYGTYEWTWTR